MERLNSEQIDLVIDMIKEISSKTRIDKDELYKIVLNKLCKKENNELKK